MWPYLSIITLNVNGLTVSTKRQRLANGYKNKTPIYVVYKFSSVQFSHSVMSDSLRPHELQHARPPCPSPTPRVHPNSCPLSRWCNPGISSSVIPFSSCPQSLPASEYFPMSQLFAQGGQSICDLLVTNRMGQNRGLETSEARSAEVTLPCSLGRSLLDPWGSSTARCGGKDAFLLTQSQT